MGLQNFEVGLDVSMLTGHFTIKNKLLSTKIVEPKLTVEYIKNPVDYTSYTVSFTIFRKLLEKICCFKSNDKKALIRYLHGR